MIDEIAFQLMATEDGRADPYPLYEQLRELGPVLKSEELPVWYLTGFDDCRELLRHPDCGKGDGSGAGIVAGAASSDRPEDRDPSMLFMDPPDHTRLRGLVSRAFTPRRVAKLRGKIEAMVDEIVDGVSGEVDLIELLAYPLPVRVIGELVGVPVEDRDQFRPLTAKLVKTLEPIVSDDDRDAARDAGDEFRDYLTGLIASRRSDPQDDLVSGLIEARDGRDALTDEEMISTIILIYAAGFETTTNLIANGTYALLRHPDQLELVCRQQDLIPGAVEEMLRWESPVQLDGRETYAPIEIAGVSIPKNHGVVTFLGAANRDPKMFDRPGEFDVTRTDLQIMSFGSGIHYCLGAALARLEGQVVFEKMLSHFSSIELVKTPTWRGSLTLRGLTALQVSLTP